MRPVSLVFFFLLLGHWLFAQGVGLPLDYTSNHLIDRWDVLYRHDYPLFTGMRFYQRKDVAAMTLALPVDTLERVAAYNRQWVLDDNNEWLVQDSVRKTISGKRNGEGTLDEHALLSLNSPQHRTQQKALLGALYRTPAHLWEVNSRNFYLRVNPLLNFQYGRDSEEERVWFWNQRGIALRGAVDDRVYFYSQLIETQSRFPNYVNRIIRRDRAVPGAGFYKNYQSTLFDIHKGYDYLTGQGYVGFNVSKHIGMQLGHGRHFIGNGYRSLLLSAYATNYFYLKFNTKIWRIHYQNLFTEMKAGSNADFQGDERIPKKYMAAHYLGLQVNPSLQLGLYEAVIFSGDFELQYLNPLILYRVIEQSVGSPDNALLGLDWKANMFGHFQFYGQLMFDEFKFDELIVERNGWWANKFGFQAGLKYYNALNISHLDLRAEYNQVRPFTYSHNTPDRSYTHYNQSLAHPLGSNFEEWVLTARYQPLPRLSLHGRIFLISGGENPEEINMGSNPLLPNTTRTMEYGNEIGQGVDFQTTIINGVVEYELFHQAYIGLECLYRNRQSDSPDASLRTLYVGGGFRLNLARSVPFF